MLFVNSLHLGFKKEMCLLELVKVIQVLIMQAHQSSDLKEPSTEHKL